MNLKRIFGAVLTVLGIAGLIYTGINYTQHSGDLRTVIVIGVLGVIFFFTGISLVRTTKDEA